MTTVQNNVSLTNGAAGTNAASAASPAAPKAAPTTTKGGKSVPESKLVVRDLRDEFGEAIAGRVQAKLTIIQSAKQQLARAKDTLSDAKALEAEGKRIAREVADTLYQARRDEILPDVELSGVLGDIFGYKVRKSDGAPSKTPDGAGEDIRKRVRFLVSAREAVMTPDGQPVARTFANMDKDMMAAIADQVAAVDAGTITIYTAFDNIAEIRKEGRVTIERAFDPKHIAGLVDALSSGTPDEVSAKHEAMRKNEALIAAYTALRNVTDEIFKVAVPKE